MFPQVRGNGTAPHPMLTEAHCKNATCPPDKTLIARQGQVWRGVAPYLEQIVGFEGVRVVARRHRPVRDPQRLAYAQVLVS
jgi:hypothetical protein